MARTKNKRENHHKELYGILFLALGVFFGLCLLSYNPSDPALNSASNIEQISNLGGVVGAYLADILFAVLGISAYVLCGALILMSAMQFMGGTIKTTWPKAIAYTILVIAASTILHLRFEVVEIAGQPIGGGGLIGSLLGVVLEKFLNKPGAFVVASALFVIAFFYATHISVRTFLAALQITVVFIASSSAKLVVLTGRGIAAAAEHAWPAIVDSVLATGKFFANLYNMIIEKLKRENSEEVRINRKSSAKSQTKTAVLASQKANIKEDEDDDEEYEEEEEGDDEYEEDVDEDEEYKDDEDDSDASDEENEKNVKIYARTDSRKKKRSAQLELAHMSKGYKFPPLSLLDSDEENKIEVDERVLMQNAQMLKKKLEDYGVEGKITEIHPGPVITMFEFEPAAGVKINKIAGLSDDLSVAMGGRSTRIVPHLPGKAAIGIELPNHTREIVWLKDIVSDDKFIKSASKLTVALGKNTQGATVVSDLTKMPHLLIAGATGSGKSVAINTMICSILFKARPDEVRLIMIDPKTLELKGYNGIPHLLLPVVTKPRDANMSLAWGLREMERRYTLLSDVGSKNIATYNSKIEQGTLKTITEDEAVSLRQENPEAVLHTGKLPLIVILIDELADLMMVSSKEIEENITRLAQMARAAGIHLIVATQRPSVDVITGLIKANFPTRMAFKVSSKHDSRTILDGVGAEHLLGMGDMLFVPPGTSGLARIHGAFISEEEIERVVKHACAQGNPCYDESILKPPPGAPGLEDEENDELYDTAVKIVAQTRQASISMIQRKLRIGYNRAARMIEMMEIRGIVGPADGSKPREVLVNNID